jgi:cytoskeletal protein CcmA (bactofilin family)
MLNRNGIFGSREDKLDDKAKPLGVGAHNVGGASARSGSVTESAAAVVSTPPRAAREASAGVKPDEAKGSQLLVGANIKLKGVEITDCDMLVVEGHVEATMDSRAVQIAPPGSFAGTACVDVADVHGEFTGELTVRKKLVIHATGKVSGKVRYGKLVIEEGGEIVGEITTLEQAGQQPKLTGAATAPLQPALPH